jgi:hypothetical protein
MEASDMSIVELFDNEEISRWWFAHGTFLLALGDPMFLCAHLIECAGRREGAAMYSTTLRPRPLLCANCFGWDAVEHGPQACEVCGKPDADPATCDLLCPSMIAGSVDAPDATATVVSGGWRIVAWFCAEHGGGRQWRLPGSIDVLHVASRGGDDGGAG